MPDSPVTSLAELQRTAATDLRKLATATEGERTELLRRIATVFVYAREHFYTRDGLPDWTGRTHAYRAWVRETSDLGGIPSAARGSIQAAIRYHTGNVLRDLLDDGELKHLGLTKSSPRERSVEKRARESEALSLLAGSAAIATPDEVTVASHLLAAAMRRMSLPAVRSFSPKDKRAVYEAMQDVYTLAEELLAASEPRKR